MGMRQSRRTVANSRTTIGGTPTVIDAAYIRLQVPHPDPANPPTDHSSQVPQRRVARRGEANARRMEKSLIRVPATGLEGLWRVRDGGSVGGAGKLYGALAADIRTAAHPLPFAG